LAGKGEISVKAGDPFVFVKKDPGRVRGGAQSTRFLTRSLGKEGGKNGGTVLGVAGRSPVGPGTTSSSEVKRMQEERENQENGH